MNRKAQAGLEYLMTYGWALILIAAVLGALVLIISSPASDVTFSSSDPTKILMKAGAVSSGTAEIKLQNITGGNIQITAITGQGYSACTINGSNPPIPVSAGNQMTLECTAPADSQGTITLQYTDYAGLQRTATITASGTASGNGLVAYYTFNEGSGTTAADSSGTGNNGSFQGSLTWEGTDCPDGSCLVFTTGNYVAVPYHTSLDMSNSVTIMAWVKVTSFGAWRTIAAKDNSSYGEYWFGFGTNNKHALMINPGNAPHSDRYYVYASTAILDSNWHHLAAVYNGTDVRIYLDGLLNNTPEVHSDTIYSGGGSFHVGYTLPWGVGFNGSIDEVKLYNSALSASEVCSACGPICSC